MNDLIFTGDLEEVEPGIATDIDGDEPEPEDTIGNEPMTEQERGQLLTVFTALAAEIEASITEFELRLVDSYRQVSANAESFAQSEHYAVLEALMELRPLIHQTERSALYDAEIDASIALRRLNRRSIKVFSQAEGLLAGESPTTTTP